MGIINLKGQQFGRLTVLELAPKHKGRTAWLCQCSCGNQKIVTTHSLRSDNTRSCGCLQKETASKQFSKNISNQRFGNLIAVKPTNQRRHGSIIWECKCDCGNIHYTTTESLLNGNTKSCGCICSRGNQKIKELLQQNNIIFQPEYNIRINNINYYYDFAIFNEKSDLICFIEYDGILHFPQDKYHGWNNSETWEKTQKNDKIKSNYAEEHQIPLIRIPYYDFNKIDINYLKERFKNYGMWLCNSLEECQAPS